jgi:hypothetical protein
MTMNYKQLTMGSANKQAPYIVFLGEVQINKKNRKK